jgi:ubiquinone/menaquinone biosynthesis C-methylase UbiE
MPSDNVPQSLREYLNGLVNSAIEDLKVALNEKLEGFIGNLLAKLAAIEPLLRDSMVVPGAVVLDYACGPGLFTIPAAKIVGNSGHVFAADVNPLMIKDILDYAAREGLENVTTIETSADTGLESESVDVALLFDCFNFFSDPFPILTELHRVLKGEGYLSLAVEHEEIEGAASTIENTGLFIKISQDSLHKQVLFQK